MKYLQLVLFLLFCSLLISCKLQKRKYSSGFYIGKHHTISTKAKINIIDLDKIAYQNNTKIPTVEYALSNEDSLFELANCQNAILPTLNETNKQEIFITTDTITKKEQRIKNDVNSTLAPKKKMEIFSLLSFCFYVLSIATLILIFLSVFLNLFAVTATIITLGLFSLLYPLIGFILAAIGDRIVKRHPNKYKNASLAEFLMIISILTFILSLVFYVSARINFGTWSL